MVDQALKPLSDFPSLDCDQPKVVSDGDVSLVFQNKLRVVVDGRVRQLVSGVRFDATIACYFGLPNDEALSGHPLYRLGLEPYRAYEVVASTWIHDLSVRNAVHPGHRNDSFAEMHHYVFTFKDEFFECIARAYALITEPM
jgi:hypothetical protein